MRESLVFFFSSRRRHTRCGRDWSSDVCSSDLLVGRVRGGELACLLLEREIEHRLTAASGAEARDERVRGQVEVLAKRKELRLADRARRVEDMRQELLPELKVDVLHRVDPEAVDTEIADPRVVDLLHATDHLHVLREEVVETREVAVRGTLTREGRVPTVVVERYVVEPVRHLHMLVAGRQLRVVR